jgi:hypothetical protein
MCGFSFGQNAEVFAQTPKSLLKTPKSLLKTPKALANSSPGLERSDNPGIESTKKGATLKGLGMCAANPFRVVAGFKNE